LANDTPEPASSADLAEMQAIASGDQPALSRLIDREAPRLLRFARGLLGSLEEAEDTVQDTLVSLIENAARWRPEARIGTWLHTICYNRSIDRLRRRRAFVEESALEALADETDSAETKLIRGETVRSVREAMELLPHRQRTAILLFHFQDAPQREAAAIMGLTEDAFESLLSRARRRMRDLLASTGDRDD
jgi:RNA polymerase sigma-70 factor, ECF subfamily